MPLYLKTNVIILTPIIFTCLSLTVLCAIPDRSTYIYNPRVIQSRPYAIGHVFAIPYIPTLLDELNNDQNSSSDDEDRQNNQSPCPLPAPVEEINNGQDNGSNGQASQPNHSVAHLSSAIPTPVEKINSDLDTCSEGEEDQANPIQRQQSFEDYNADSELFRHTQTDYVPRRRATENSENENTEVKQPGICLGAIFSATSGIDTCTENDNQTVAVIDSTAVENPRGSQPQSSGLGTMETGSSAQVYYAK